MLFKVSVKSEKLFECTTKCLEQYECQQCPKFKTNFLTHFMHHMKGGHTQQNSTEVVYKCLKCSFVTHSNYFYIKHRKFDNCTSGEQQKVQKIGQKSQFACKVVEVAKQTPGDENKYESFLNEILNNQFTKKTKRNVIICSSSYKTSDETADLEEYVLVTCETKSLNNWFKCEKCNYTTLKKSLLRQHIFRRHTPNDQIHWFSCAYCAHKSSQKSNLTKHVVSKHASDHRVHWFKCDHCSYKTVEQNTLNTHIASKHTPNLRDQLGGFTCEFCSYKSSTKRNLKCHIMCQHTPKDQVRWFRCDYCAYKSFQKGHLKAHLVAKHIPQLRIDGFNCEYCDYKTAQKNKLQRHIGAKHAHFIKCGFCSYLTADQFLLNLHVALRHESIKNLRGS